MTIGIRRMATAALCSVVGLVLQPRVAIGQQSFLAGGSIVMEQGLTSEASPAAPEESVSVVAALRASGTTHARLGIQLESVRELDEEDSPLALPQESGGRRGKAFMLGGVAALVGGLIVGGDLGTVLAAGGVVLGVYGVVLYF